MRIGFDVLQQARLGYDDVVKRLASKLGVNRVLDIGRGANPRLKAAHLEEFKGDR
jgi:hypothetical protein